MKDRRDATLEKLRYLRNFVNLVVTNECDFQQPFSQAKKYSSKITCDKLLEGICLETDFDTAICVVHALALES